MTRPSRYEHVLSCGCRIVTSHPSVLGSQQLCTEHGVVRKVRKVEWSFRCLKCKYARSDVGPLTAQVKSETHTYKTGHVVEVLARCEGKVTNRWQTRERQLEIGDIPPF